MKIRQTQKIVGGKVWTWLDSEKTYVNEDGETNQRPRDTKGQRIGKANFKAHRESNSTITINNYLTYEEVSKYTITKYKQELFIFFITNLIERYKYIKWLEAEEKLNEDFYLNQDVNLRLKGIYYSTNNLRLLLNGKSSLTLLNTLQDAGWIKIQEVLNPNDPLANSYCNFITPTQFLMDKTPSKIILTKEWAINKITVYRKSLQNLHLDTENIIPILAKNLKYFTSESVYFEENKNDELHISVDDFGNRYHYCLTNLKKYYRKNLRLDGKPVIEIDIVNSQILCLALYLINNKNKGVVAFRKLALEGFFYEDIAESPIFKNEVLKIMLLKKCDAREAAKKITYRLFFGSYEYPELREYNSDLADAIRLIKIENPYKLKHRYKNISKLCQLIESKMMVRVMLELESKNIKFGYVYDSIIVNPENLIIVESIIKEEYFREYDVHIRTKP